MAAHRLVAASLFAPAAAAVSVDELLARTYSFEEINTAFEALERGEAARSVVVV